MANKPDKSLVATSVEELCGNPNDHGPSDSSRTGSEESLPGPTKGGKDVPIVNRVDVGRKK